MGIMEDDLIYMLTDLQSCLTLAQIKDYSVRTYLQNLCRGLEHADYSLPYYPISDRGYKIGPASVCASVSQLQHSHFF